jgi:MFS transporter, ACS family, tartrate transporter
MISWGAVSAGMALVGDAWSFYALRFLLGVAEAGFFPGVTFYLAFWFPAQYRARILAWFLLAIPISSLLGAPLSGAVLEMDGVLGLAGWKWMFIIEGLPAVILGVLVLRILADRPQTAPWLAPAEREILAAMLAGESRERVKSSLLHAVMDIRVIVCAIVQFGFTLGSYGVGIWLPQIIKGSGLSNFRVSLLAAIPYVFATGAMMWWAMRVDKSGKKIANLTIACALAAIGLFVSVWPDSLALALTGLTIALMGITSARAIFWTIPTRFLTGMGAAAGLAFINSIGTLGGFAGPYLMGYLKDATGTFLAGLFAMAAVLLVTTLFAASLKLIISTE